jgi:hypothetical protein
MPCSPLTVNRRFGVIRLFHLQGWSKAKLLSSLLTSSCWLFSVAYSSTLKLEAICSSEVSVEIQLSTGVMSGKINPFITTALNASSPIFIYIFTVNLSRPTHSPCFMQVHVPKFRSYELRNEAHAFGLASHLTRARSSEIPSNKNEYVGTKTPLTV